MAAPDRFFRLSATVAAMLVISGAVPAAAGGGSASGGVVADARADQGPALGILLAELEGLLGRPLDGAARTRCVDAGRRAVSALREQDHVFFHSVASLLGLAPELLATVRGDGQAIDPALAEGLLGRSFTAFEKARMEELQAGRDLAAAPVRSSYARDLSTATGLPPPAILPLLPRMGI